jgi:hypothetical protein
MWVILQCVKTCRNIHCDGIKIKKNTMHTNFFFCIINKKIQNTR